MRLQVRSGDNGHSLTASLSAAQAIDCRIRSGRSRRGVLHRRGNDDVEEAVELLPAEGVSCRLQRLAARLALAHHPVAGFRAVRELRCRSESVGQVAADTRFEGSPEGLVVVAEIA